MLTSQNRIDMLKKRTKRCCCKYCGSPLEIRRIIYGSIEDARVEIFCSGCNRIEYGTEPAIYQAAKYFVEQLQYNAYPDLDLSAKTQQMSIAKVCEIMAWCCENLGLVGEDGFNMPLSLSNDLLGEMTVYNDEDLPDGSTILASIDV